jgi:hypothetical protein
MEVVLSVQWSVKTKANSLTTATRFSCAHGIEEAEKLLDVSDLERIVDAVTHTHQRQASSAVLARDVGSHKCSDASRIHIGDVGEIDNQRTRGVGAHCGLKAKYSGHDQRAVEAKNSLARLASGLVINAKSLLRHGGDINACVILNC